MAIKLFEEFHSSKPEVGKVYVTTEEINGENQEQPNDFDFETGTKFLVNFVKADTVVAEEPESDSGETWAFDLEEFNSKTKILGRPDKK